MAPRYSDDTNRVHYASSISEPNPAYEIPQIFTNRGDHFNMANQASLGRYSATSAAQTDNNNGNHISIPLSTIGNRLKKLKSL